MIADHAAVGTATGVDAEDLLLEDGGEGQAVEDRVDLLPDLERVLLLALVVEACAADNAPACD